MRAGTAGSRVSARLTEATISPRSVYRSSRGGAPGPRLQSISGLFRMSVTHSRDAELLVGTPTLTEPGGATRFFGTGGSRRAGVSRPLNLRPHDDRPKFWHRYDTATRRTPVFAGPSRTQQKGPDRAFPLVRAPFPPGTPDRIRTGATALRGRRARPLHNGGKLLRTASETLAVLDFRTKSRPCDRDLAGIQGLEP
jgi:hypothetical protein